jgi:uncharacterized protein YuzE
MFKCALSLCPLLLLASCGKHIQESKPLVVQEASISEGAFHARLKRMNQKAAGASNGMAKMDIAGDNIVIDVDMLSTPVGVTHQQFIRSGKRCPTITDDLNKDGYIDAQEERKVVGDIIVALDDDLHQEYDGNFPYTNDAAAYYYTETGSIILLNSNIKGNLKLDGKIVTVHGINKEILLPSSVASRDGRPASTTLPIACGKIFPGFIDQ